MRRHRQLVLVLGTALVAAAAAAPATAINIQFDYTYDTNGFFADPFRRQVLEQAAGTFRPLTDSLSAIVPSSNFTWDARFTGPGTGSPVSVPGLVVPANTLIVYAGGRPLDGDTLGMGGSGGWGASGSGTQQQIDAWFNLLDTRGQIGATRDFNTSTDFGPWGGHLTFDTGTDWYFGPRTNGLLSAQSDFLSVAIHELAHVLGVGGAPSWYHDIDSFGDFVGPAVVATNSGPVELDLPEAAHWSDLAFGYVARGVPQQPAMSPNILTGTRKVFTDLDYAGLKDIGWQVPVPDADRPGDANADGVINASDLAMIQAGVGLSGWHNGDFTGNGIADQDDYALFLQYAALNPGASPAVPEPSSLAAAMLLPALLPRRRH